MKRKLQMSVLTMVMGLLLTGCCMSHSWEEATCDSAKVCTKCGEVEGEALGHAWKDADCTTAKTCTTCGDTEGVALGHAWKEATLTEAKTCTTCRLTEGVPDKEAVLNAAESFLKAADEVDIDTVSDSCMGFVLSDLSLNYLRKEALVRDFYISLDIEESAFGTKAQEAILAYGESCADYLIQGYTVQDVEEKDGKYVVNATIRTFAEDAENPIDSDELMWELEAMSEQYIEDNMDTILGIYFLEGEEAALLMVYDDLIPEVIEICQQAIEIIETEDVAVQLTVEKLGDRWVITEASKERIEKSDIL